MMCRNEKLTYAKPEISVRSFELEGPILVPSPGDPVEPASVKSSGQKTDVSDDFKFTWE